LGQAAGRCCRRWCDARSSAPSRPCAQVRATQLAHQDADRIINKEMRFFTARTLPSRSRDLSLWARISI
jgi:hypothetical protein